MAKASIIYNENIATDNIQLLSYINDFTKGLGEKLIEIDPDIIYYKVLQAMRQDFPYVNGLENANVFKKAAYFMCWFIGEQPIIGAFSDKNVGSLASLSNHQNAIVAFQVAIASLHGATVRHDTTDVVLNNRIRLSSHSYIDIISAIREASVHSHYKMITVLLEQLAYKENPGCQFELLDF